MVSGYKPGAGLGRTESGAVVITDSVRLVERKAEQFKQRAPLQVRQSASRSYKTRDALRLGIIGQRNADAETWAAVASSLSQLIVSHVMACLSCNLLQILPLEAK